MSKPRYSVWGAQDQASRWSPDHINWNDANRALQAVGADWRIWDHATTPPTDVTDADPEKKPEPWVRYVKHGSTPRGAAFFVGYGSSSVSDTPPADGSPYYRVTVERIDPEPEQPKLWVWDVRDAEWSVHADSAHPPYAEVTTCGPNGTVVNLYVTATTKTRDALRDEALSWAARAAGKGGEG